MSKWEDERMGRPMGRWVVDGELDGQVHEKEGGWMG